MICTADPLLFVIKSRRMRWAVHVACMGRREVYKAFWFGKQIGRDHLEDPSIDGRIILSLVFRKWTVGAWIGSLWLRIWTSGRHL